MAVPSRLLERILDTIGVIQPLRGSLGTRTGLAKVERMVGIPLNLEGSPLLGANHHSTTCRALTAGGGIIGALAVIGIFRHADVRLAHYVT